MSVQPRRSAILSALIRPRGVTVAMFCFPRAVVAAQTSPPPYAHASYVTNPDPTVMYNLGSSDGSYDSALCRTGLINLDFGQPTIQAGIYGTNYFGYGSPFLSDLAVVNAAENYARGWYDHSGSCTSLRLALGTNNYNQIPTGGGTPTTAGSDWALIVSATESYLSSNNYSWQVNAVAADDMEQPSGAQLWDCSTKTRAFVDGYNSSGSLSLFDDGTAWVPVQGCWTAADVAYVAWGAAVDYPLPEIYSGYATDSWIAVRQLYSMAFSGVLTECAQADPLPPTDCSAPVGQFAPNGAWYDLWNKLNSHGVGQPSLDYATNIRFQ